MSSLRILSRRVLPAMHLKLLISVVLSRPLAMVVSTLVSVVITGLAQVLRILVLLLELVYSCFSKLYRVGRIMADIMAALVVYPCISSFNLPC